MSQKTHHNIPVVSNDKTAVEIIADETALSRQKIKQAMQKGCVWLETTQARASKPTIQRLRRAKKVVSKGDVLHCYYDEDILQSEPAEALLINDFGDYSIWRKPAGMLSQGSKWGDHCTLYRFAEKQLKPERPAFIVHRLDRAASGLMILAHKKKTASHFSKLFKYRHVEKHYLVHVEGDFCAKHGQDEFTINNELEGKNAISHIQFESYDAKKNRSTLKVRIETGRKHQIRQHLSGLGFAVLGDRLYGSKNTSVDLQLSAVFLKFKCPMTGKLREFSL